MSLRTLPPTGAPIRFRDVITGIRAQVADNGAAERFRHQVKDYFGTSHCYLLSSGKAALYVLMRALLAVSERREVVIPAYSSFCLASIMARSGVLVKLCDVDENYLDLDLDHLNRLVDEKTLAVIPVHLFGLVARLDDISRIARSKGAFVIEDAAQAAGAVFQGKKVGTVGDAGIFSLGRGKSISTVEGGVVVTSSQTIADSLSGEVEALRLPSAFYSAKQAVVGFALSLFMNPRLYFLPQNLPGLNIGANVYDPGFEVMNLTRLQAGTGVSNFGLLDKYNCLRNENAEYLRLRLRECRGISLVREMTNIKPALTRFPVICKDSDTRENMFQALNRHRLGVSRNFPHPLNEIEAFQASILNAKDTLDKSKQLSQRLLTVPTHPFVEKEDMDKMVRLLCI